MAVSLLLVFSQLLTFVSPRHSRAGARTGHLLDLLRRRDRARPAVLDRPDVRGGRSRPRALRRRRGSARCSCRSCCRRSSPARNRRSRSRSTTSSISSSMSNGANSTTVPMQIYDATRATPQPALDARRDGDHGRSRCSRSVAGVLVYRCRPAVKPAAGRPSTTSPDSGSEVAVQLKREEVTWPVVRSSSSSSSSSSAR